MSSFVLSTYLHTLDLLTSPRPGIMNDVLFKRGFKFDYCPACAIIGIARRSLTTGPFIYNANISLNMTAFL